MLADIRRTFAPLGWTAFGGPTAHLGYFRTSVVDRRRWMADSTYADLVALSQFLPGPGSSKVGMAIGYDRAGLTGMAYSWFWFTWPSAVIMAGFGLTLNHLPSSGWIAGLLAAAVGVVLHAVLGMGQKLITGWVTAAIAVTTFVALFWVPQLVLLVLGGLVGIFTLRPRGEMAPAPPLRKVSAPLGWGCAVAFLVLLVGLDLLARCTDGWWFTRINAFYQAGALVFGGGHVVLPLLEDKFVATGWISEADFLSGYSVAQAMPGPLFTFASYVGAVDSGLIGALIGTVFIFLPGALLTLGGLYFWGIWRDNLHVRGAFAGVNAVVVGLLAHTLWNPIITHGITGVVTGIIAAAVFVALQFGKAPPWSVAVVAAAVGFVLL